MIPKIPSGRVSSILDETEKGKKNKKLKKIITKIEKTVQPRILKISLQIPKIPKDMHKKLTEGVQNYIKFFLNTLKV